MNVAEGGWLARFERLSALAGEPMFSLGTNPVTPFRVLGFLLVIFVVAWLTSLVERGLQRYAAHRPNGDRSALYTASRILRYTFWVVGSLLALNIVGVNLSAIALLTGAIGIGIGLGMQGLFNNIVSGFFLLGEKALRVGDVITLENGSGGTIRNIGLRHTLLANTDGGHFMVPNSELVLKTVTHWTLERPLRRLHIPFKVARESDRRTVEATALASLAHLPANLTDSRQTPEVWLTELGEQGLAFELIIWLGREGLERPYRTRALYLAALHDALTDAGIAAPAAHAQVQLPHETLSVRLESDTTNKG